MGRARLGLVAVILFGAFVTSAAAQSNAGSGSAIELLDRLDWALKGLPVGHDIRFLPYVTMGEFLDFYGAFLLEHPTFWNDTDRIYQSLKFEEAREFSWKLRYLAYSVSGPKTTLGFLLKIKSSDDVYYYGIGNNTIKARRRDARYFSLFVGSEMTYRLAPSLHFRWSPGIWHVKSGLEEGGEFEPASSATYMTGRFSLFNRPLDYASYSLQSTWSAYAEIGAPLSAHLASYARLNTEGAVSLPLYSRTRMLVNARVEALFSENRTLVPYNALPEVGSRSGLRGFSRERFRNYAVATLRLEYLVPLARGLDAFLLTDMARTARDVPGLTTGDIHQAVGLGARLVHGNTPMSVGVAAGSEGWRLFTDVTLALP